MITRTGRDSLERQERPAAIAIGTFDGVHKGHRALISRTIEYAKEHDMVSTVLTWDRHPSETVRPDSVPLQLATIERKSELIKAGGVDQLVILEFDETLAKWTPDEFARKVLAEGLGAGAVFVGKDWRFGHKAKGDVELLTQLGRELGFEVEGVTLDEVAGGPASSTRVRKALANGDLEFVSVLLGRPFDVDGKVIKGDGRGAGLGWPTANIATPGGYAHPPRGVYAGRARARGQWYPAAINVGVNPTFGGEEGVTPMRIEAYLLDFDDDLYGENIRLEWHKRLRDERKFDDIDELIKQIAQDVADTRELTEAG
ncbi:MAG TPA: bifunctional riboflavin kinase/FAD synthetase [Actinomycetota bacterium]|nr:bifunctional riboflavin kinase/FAD synthetase [Actinomycetota bacterium]